MPGSLGSKPVELSDARAALEDGKTWCALGTVAKREDGKSFELLQGSGGTVDVLVEVDLKPHGEQITARLAMAGPGVGFWYIPPVGTEVAVLLPEGELDNDPMIVGVLSTNAVPATLAADTAVLVVPANLQVVATNGTILQKAAGKITVQSTGDDVEIDAGSGKQVKLAGGGAAIGRVGDPVDMGTFQFTPGSGAAALAWIPPGGGTPVNLTPAGSDLTGSIKQGSSKAQSG